jgi:hypothetical protein
VIVLPVVTIYDETELAQVHRYFSIAISLELEFFQSIFIFSHLISQWTIEGWSCFCNYLPEEAREEAGRPSRRILE